MLRGGEGEAFCEMDTVVMVLLLLRFFFWLNDMLLDVIRIFWLNDMLLDVIRNVFEMSVRVLSLRLTSLHLFRSG